MAPDPANKTQALDFANYFVSYGAPRSRAARSLSSSRLNALVTAFQATFTIKRTCCKTAAEWRPTETLS